MMRVVKGFLVFCASSMYVLLLALTPAMLSLRFTLAEPATLKGWLDRAGVYEQIVPEVAKLASVERSTEDGAVRITSDDILDSAQAAFPSSTLKKDGESVIDGFYGWFKGDTTGPEFRLDYTEEKNTLAILLATNLKNQLDKLPSCTTTNLLTSQTFDPFTADCRPRSLDTNKIASDFAEDLATTDQLLSETLITGGDIKVGGDRIGSSLPWIPRVYGLLFWLPWLTAGLMLLSVCTLLFLTKNRRKGMRTVAHGLLLIGSLLLLFGLFARPLSGPLNSTIREFIGAEASINEKIIDPLFEEALTTYAPWNIAFGGGYIALACVCYGYMLLTRTKKEDSMSGELGENIDHESDVEQGTTEPVASAHEQTDVEQSPPNQTQRVHAQDGHPTPQPVARQSVAQPVRRPVTRRPPMIQG